MMNFKSHKAITVIKLVHYRCLSLFKQIKSDGGGWQPMGNLADRSSLFWIGALNALRPQNRVLGFSKARLCSAG